MNDEAAGMAFGIAQRSFETGEFDKALRFCRKSLSLNPSTKASQLLAKIEAAQASPSGSSSARAPPATNAATRPTGPKVAEPEQAKRNFTPDQLALVKKVKACRVTE